MNHSPLQMARYAYKPKLPTILESQISSISVEIEKDAKTGTDEKLKSIFKNLYGKSPVVFKSGNNASATKKINMGVILSGGQAPGGHNVIAGIFDGLKAGNSESTLIGFLGGPGGLIDNKSIVLDKKIVDEYRNTGGFDIICSGRTKIETPEQFGKSAETVKAHKLDALVIIGGDDSNTNAALLAEYFCSLSIPCSVIGVPKTIDGDLKNEYIEASFGFDTAAKTYSELIGNIERDANSARKYWHFVKLMGRSASHIALECALQTRPNITLISEEIEAKKQTLKEITEYLCKVICARAEDGNNFGVALIPEGIIEFMPDFKSLIAELNDMMAVKGDEFNAQKRIDDKVKFVEGFLKSESHTIYVSLPVDIKRQLVMDRDPHGNVQVSKIETEKLLIAMVEKRLSELKAEGKYTGKFNALSHFFGYEGRCAFPSNFDTDYCYSLGYSAFILAVNGFTGYLSSIRNLSKPATEWKAGGVPLPTMMHIEHRHGQDKPVIEKALVKLDGAPFKAFEKSRAEWEKSSDYRYPGAIQYYGPSEVCDRPTETLLLEHQN